MILPAHVIRQGFALPPAEAAVVAELFSSSLQEGRSLKAVTKQITDLGVPTPGGGTRWNQATSRGMFTNPVYTGTVSIGRSRPTEARGRHSALVPIGRGRGGHTQTTQQEWIAVIAAFQRSSVKSSLTSSRRNSLTISSLLGATLPRIPTSYAHWSGVEPADSAAWVEAAGGGYAYYVCHGKSHGIISRRDEKCPARSVPVEQLDELVWQDG